jgi:hypothetical protein
VEDRGEEKGVVCLAVDLGNRVWLDVQHLGWPGLHAVQDVC